MTECVQVAESLGDTGLLTPTTGPTAPALCYTPLAVILLFWETSAAALACQSKKDVRTQYHRSASISALERYLVMNVLILGDLFLE